MTKKQIPRKLKDSLYVIIYIVLLLVFAGYESDRKANALTKVTPPAEQSADSTVLRLTKSVIL